MQLLSAHTHYSGRTVLALIFCLFIITADMARGASGAIGGKSNFNDIDSQVYSSTDIVEGKLINSIKNIDQDRSEIEVIAVHTGNLTVGQTIIVEWLSQYRKYNEKMVINTVPFEQGDTLVLFLVKNNISQYGNNRDKVDTYRAINFGIRLIQQDMVYQFMPAFLGARYLAQNSTSTVNDLPPTTLDVFHNQLRASIGYVNGWKARINEPSIAQDISWLVQFLRERKQTQIPIDNDAIAHTICEQLANLHNYAVLYEILSLNLSRQEQSIIIRGFATPEGRDYLLAKIDDDKETLERRIMLADGVKDIGDVYHASATNITEQSYVSKGGAKDGNANYLTRIADLALKNEKQESLCITLVRSLAALLKHSMMMGRKPLHSDTNDAMLVLNKLYTATKSELVRYHIEIAASNDSRATYDQLNSPSGAIISLVTPAKTTQQTDEPIHRFNYTITPLDTVVESALIVFSNQDTNAVFQFPVRSSNTSPTITGIWVINSDTNIPRGKYRVYLQFAREGKVVSTGHYCEVEL